jgi:hypothetical protein
MTIRSTFVLVAAAGLASSAAAQTAYVNCNLTTGATTLSGTAAPTGAQWSEVARYANDPTSANTTAGFGGTGALRLADDFVVGAGGLNLTAVRFPCYLTGSATVSVTAATLQIWNGPPDDPTSTVIFGDPVTNRMTSAAFIDAYRTFNTVVAPACGGAPTAPGTTRHIQMATIAAPINLAAGTYWIDVNYTGASFSPPATAANASQEQCNPNNANAKQFNAGWVALTDAGQGCAPVAVPQDLYFELVGTTSGPACYANCDNSTTVPFLNVLDFNCFLNRFSAGDSYANCDNSTIPPTLNVLDFNCFLNRFSAGCSAP